MVDFPGAAAPHPAKPLKRLDLNFKILCIRQSASPVVVESDCHLLYVFILGIFCEALPHTPQAFEKA